MQGVAPGLTNTGFSSSGPLYLSLYTSSSYFSPLFLSPFVLILSVVDPPWWFCSLRGGSVSAVESESLEHRGLLSCHFMALPKR
jgi:hypothetical protein